MGQMQHCTGSSETEDINIVSIPKQMLCKRSL